MTTRWVLLGPGRHADSRVVPQMKQATDTELCAVVSRDRTRGEAFARKHGIAKVYTSLEEALGDGAIDAVYDATPDGLHPDHAEASAKAGKHILIEKPLAISVTECQRAVTACRRRGVTLGVVFNQRHEAVHNEARRLIAAGEIGELRLAYVQLPLARPGQTAAVDAPARSPWRSDPTMRAGGMAASIADHSFDTLCYVAGQEIDAVSAFTDATSSTPPDERVAGVLLKLSGGAIGYATSAAVLPFARRPFEFHGTKGSLILANTYSYLVGADGPPSLELVTAAGRMVRQIPETDCFRLEIERFNRAISGHDTPTTSGDEALRAQATVTAIYAAIRDGRVARVAEFLPKTA
jgi:1,5-anhydro-D-fructose reductase (1,5-anhydro-D-mannitol-forming)